LLLLLLLLLLFLTTLPLAHRRCASTVVSVTAAFICLHCKLTSHEGHETEDMATAARRAKDELAGVKVKAVEQVRATSLSNSLCKMLYYHFP
jgi:hypothetical protein